jgi:hypothetical protein
MPSRGSGSGGREAAAAAEARELSSKTSGSSHWAGVAVGSSRRCLGRSSHSGGAPSEAGSPRGSSIHSEPPAAPALSRVWFGLGLGFGLRFGFGFGLGSRLRFGSGSGLASPNPSLSPP